MKRLDAAEEELAQGTAAGNLDAWSSDQLFAETVARRAEDAPALRLMQGVLLEALLAERDRAVAVGNVAS